MMLLDRKEFRETILNTKASRQDGSCTFEKGVYISILCITGQCY